MKKITIITGHYGSGKTNLAVNLAMLAKNENVCVVDLDIVNPYFRTADFKDLFEKNNIKLISPIYANSNLDIPALNFDLEQIVFEYDYVIIDVGGDDAGATALGRYAEALNNFIEDIEMIYVVNGYRYLTKTADEAIELMYDIEKNSRMTHTAIVNNSNLGNETTAEIVEDSLEFASEVAEKLNLPLLYSTCPNQYAELCQIEDVLPIEIYVKPIWEL